MLNHLNHLQNAMIFEMQVFELWSDQLEPFVEAERIITPVSTTKKMNFHWLFLNKHAV